MALKTKAQLAAELAASYADNTNGDITPSDLRTQQQNMIDSLLGLNESASQTVPGPVNFTGGLTENGLSVTCGETVIVNAATDLPAAVAGVRTLVAGTTYLISGTIDLGTDRLVLASNTALVGRNRYVDRITSATTGALITATLTHTVRELALYQTGATGSVFALTGGLTETAVYTNAFIAQCYQAGTVTAWSSMSFRSFSIVNCSNRGILFAGACGSLAISSSVFSSNVGTSIDLGTATFNSVQIDAGNRFNVGSGRTGLSAAASSANINSGGRGILHGCIFIGLGTYVSGLTTSDVKWYLNNNGGAIGDSRNVAQGYITGNATNTTFTGTGSGNEVTVKFGTGFISDIASRFTISNAGVVTYVGLDPIDVMIDSSIFASISGGTARKYIYFWYKNGVKVTAVGAKVQYDGSTPAASSCTGVISLVYNDYIDLRIQAVDATTTVVVDTCNINLVGL